MLTQRIAAIAATATLMSSTAAFAQTELAWVNVDGTMVQVNYALAGEACGLDDSTIRAQVAAMSGGAASQEGGAALGDPSTADTATLNATGQDTDASADLAADVAATTDSAGLETDTADLGSAATADTATLNETGQTTDANADMAADVAATTDTTAMADGSAMADDAPMGTVPMQALCAITANRASELGFPAS